MQEHSLSAPPDRCGLIAAFRLAGFRAFQESRPDRSEVIVEVQRFAGGQRAGSKGILELVKKPESAGFKNTGLQFAKLVNEQVDYSGNKT